MPEKLMCTAPRTVEFVPYEDRLPGPDEVRLETVMTGIKNGTEMALYRGTTPFREGYLDSQTRLFTPRSGGANFFPFGLGNWGVGKVTHIGEEVTRFRKGERVHGPLGHQPTHTVPAARLMPLGDLTPEAAMLTDPAFFALAIVHDAEIKLGDRVAIFGMGAIGLMAVQAAKLSGARQVIAVDRINMRLAAARRLGADELLNPSHGDPGTVIKELTGGAGVDVAIEISGSTHALHDCVRCVHVAGLVVAGAYYQGDAVGLRLGEEWHHNRPTLKSSMAVWNCPHRNYPMWTEDRLMETTTHLLAAGQFRSAEVITHRFKFDQLPEAYRTVDERPAEIIKAIITY